MDTPIPATPTPPPEPLDAILAEARDKYTVHDCNECDYRKSCECSFDSDECTSTRKSISLALGIEDGYFTKLLDRIEAAVKREREAARPFVGVDLASGRPTYTCVAIAPAPHTSDIFEVARKTLEDESWIDEITAPDEDGEPNDYARRVVPLDDALAALDCIEAPAAAELRCLRGHIRRLLDAVDALYAVAAPRAIVRELTPDRMCLGVPIGRIVADARAMLSAQPQTPNP